MKKIKPPITSSNSLFPKIQLHNSKNRKEFKGRYLKQQKVTFTTNNVVNLFIVYESDRWSKDSDANFTLKDCLFVELLG